MMNPDRLLVDISALVESGQSNQMSLTVVVGGAVITGRLAPEAVWRERVSEVLNDSDRLGPFSAVFGAEPATDGPDDGPDDGPEGGDRGEPPAYLHFHLARILQGNIGIPETGGMYRVAIEDVSAWTVGDVSYSDH
ncbi:hypothetical protein QFZ24_005200 [Streptomyces phaeochromogenes]|jgi:hypothetical protein|uniref:hypothetical protein n=1 Tax=Streptomyces phaeochromogenes TaxID=1923 RepID=UPI0027908922|nr:hypothetical protein [Streptomyces phaeochromogenes]MDQ0951277.1 hypothetical protein [Streptomyces phaeochromogenes]